VRLYLIGAGVIARTHAAAAAHLEGPVEILAADPSVAARAGFAEAFPTARLFEDAATMLAAEEASDDDVAVIATPPRHHLAPALAALHSGRSVLVEKPLAMDAAEADELLEAARSAGRLLGTCSTRFRGLPHTEAVKRALADGLIGTPYHLRFQTVWARSRAGIEYQPETTWFLDSREAGGGVLMDWGPYDVSTLLDLLRPDRIDVLAAWTGSPRTGGEPAGVVHDTESHVGASLLAHLRSGHRLPVTFERANHTPGETISRAELHGTRGAISWVPFDSALPVLHHAHADGEPVVRELPRAPRSPLTPFDRPLVFFVDRLRGRPSFATVDAAAADEARIIDAIYRTASDAQARSIEVRGPIATLDTVRASA
jgi:predicted dehydrogenase